jgi:hypothetical protein
VTHGVDRFDKFLYFLIKSSRRTPTSVIISILSSLIFISGKQSIVDIINIIIENAYISDIKRLPF